jgi:large subunit ribosomal protein L20
MAKVKHSVATRRKKRRLLKDSKGYFGDRKSQFQQARRTRMHALVYAYRDRRNKKRVFRSLWVTRINAACRQAGYTYSGFMSGLKKAKVEIDRKILAELAVNDPKTFEKLLQLVKA